MDTRFYLLGILQSLRFLRVAVVGLLGTALTFGGLSFAAAARPVTAEQLEQVLAADGRSSDAEIASQLGGLVLTERLSPARLARCEANLHGPRARQALMVLADVAAFLDLPSAAEVPPAAAPDVAAQRQMLALTVNYVIKTVHELPNFFATRTTTSFQLPENKSWSSTGRSSVKVIYRKGEEVIDAGARQGGSGQGLASSGEFGPILGTVMLDAAQGALSWSHWEQGAAGREAVFSFSVSAAKSHYELAYCCIEKYGSPPVPFKSFSGYHGEIAVDPANGTILRLVLRADLKKSDPFSKADIFVEYGPVEIGGKTYICPVKSAAYSVSDWREIGTWLNDVAFEQYHVYRADTRILP